MRRTLAWLAAAALAGCNTTPPQVHDGKQLIAQGHVDEGLAMLQQVAAAHPADAAVHNAYVMQRSAIVNAFVREGDVLRAYGDLDSAEASYRQALHYDPASVLAQTGLDQVARERRLNARADQANEALKRGDLRAAEQLARGVLAENSSQRGARAVMRAVMERRVQETTSPVLKAALTRPISLEFRDAPIRSVFEVISRTAGINFVFDRDVRPDLRTTLFVRNTNLDDVIRLLLVTNQLDRKVINENSILVYPNTPAKQKEYQELVVRSFYLANADVKQTAAMIRALVKTRDLYIDEKLNLLVVRDTPDAVRLAEQLVATQDLGEPEVVLELEVLEVATSLIQDFGLQYPSKINYGVLGVNPDTTVNASNGATTITQTGASTPPLLVELKPSQWIYFVANPAFVLNINKVSGTTNLLANPRVRVKNREKARVHIGEKVPVITTTSTANVGVSSSVSYLDTGLKLDVEPNIYLEDEVAIKVQLEVSNILSQLNISGTVAYTIGTRTAATVLRLRDGETEVLAGLINDDDRRTATGLPWLSDFPVLGQLFRTNSDQRTKTEIVLLITPRVVRNLSRPDTVTAQFSSGTDAAPGAPPLRLAATGPGALALAPAAGALAPAPKPALPGAPAAPGPAAGEPISIALTAPGQAAVGQEFVVSLGLGSGSEGAKASLELSYDPSVLNLVGGAAPKPPAPGAPAPPEPGRVLVEVAGAPFPGASAPPTGVRFRVVAKTATTTQIGIQSVSATDGAGRDLALSVPSMHSLSITAAQGAQ